MSTLEYLISSDPKRLDPEYIHAYLSQSYWAKGRTLDEVKSCIKHSLNFGVFVDDKQVGYARVVTDYTLFAYMFDVFIDPKLQGKGLGRALIKTVLEHPELQNIKRWQLGTLDAHGLYTAFGFTELEYPERMMERKDYAGFPE